jgi:hypothetical protein
MTETTGAPFPNNTIPADRIASPRQRRCSITFPNLAQPARDSSRTTSGLPPPNPTPPAIGVRFLHSFGPSSGGSPIGGLIRQYMGQGGPGLRQSVNVNFNYSHAAADELISSPSSAVSSKSHQYSLALGYSIGKGRLTTISASTGTAAIRSSELFHRQHRYRQPDRSQRTTRRTHCLYGLPNVTLNQFTSFNEQQPNFQINQTIAASDSTSWIHKKHNIRFGGDFRRVHNDLFGNTGNVTGTFTFTGFFTEKPGPAAPRLAELLHRLFAGRPAARFAATDFAAGARPEVLFAAECLGCFAQDSWRALPSLTLLFGLRYEYFSPYSEKYDRLSTLDTGNNFASVATVVSGGIGPYTGKYPRDLIYPERNNFSPRIGIAVRAAKDTVVRAGYGINYAVGQYAKFIQDFAFQPPYANVQTNETTGRGEDQSGQRLPAPRANEGNYAVNKNYRLPYVQVWNINLQRTLPLGIVLNIGYNGSKGTRLDIVDAPGRSANASLSNVFYDYEQSVAFSNYNALTVSARKRLQRGIALAATYTYSHSIDNASSIGGNGGSATVVAQNWQNLLAEESNSSFDIRNQVTGNFLYELPFGPDEHFITTGGSGMP